MPISCNFETLWWVFACSSGSTLCVIHRRKIPVEIQEFSLSVESWDSCWWIQSTSFCCMGCRRSCACLPRNFAVECSYWWIQLWASYVGLSVTYRTRYYPLRRYVRPSWTCSAQSREDIYIYIYVYGFQTRATLGRYDAAQGIAVQLLQNYAAVVTPEEDRVYKQHTKSLRFCCKRKSRARAAKSS